MSRLIYVSLLMLCASGQQVGENETESECELANVRLLQKKVVNHVKTDKTENQRTLMEEEHQLIALTKSLHDGKIDAIDIKEYLSLAMNISSAKLKIRPEAAEQYVRRKDKNGDGKLDAVELPPAIRSSDDDLPDADEVPVVTEASAPSPSLLQSNSSSNSSGHWSFFNLDDDFPCKMYTDPMYFKPSVFLGYVQSPGECLFDAYVSYSDSCNMFHKYFYTNGDPGAGGQCHCWSKEQGYNGPFRYNNAAMGWFHSTTGNHIYRYTGYFDGLPGENMPG